MSAHDHLALAREARRAQAVFLLEVDRLSLPDALADPRAAGIRLSRLLKCFYGKKTALKALGEADVDGRVKVRDLTPEQGAALVVSRAYTGGRPRLPETKREKERREARERRAALPPPQPRRPRKAAGPFVRRTTETPEGKRLRELSHQMKAETLDRMVEAGDPRGPRLLEMQEVRRREGR